MEAVTVQRFLSVSVSGSGSGSGSGYGYVCGSGYGSGYVSGYGYGSGYGSGSGSGDGSGDSNGRGLAMLNGEEIHMIDGLQTILRQIKGNVARGAIVNMDLTLTPCFVVKQGNVFAHGTTLRNAMSALSDKLFDNMPEDARIQAFVDAHPSADTAYPNQDLYDWHHKLTGSCEAGRTAFAKDHDIDMDGSMTVSAFIDLTEHAYNGGIIQKLKPFYGLSGT